MKIIVKDVSRNEINSKSKMITIERSFQKIWNLLNKTIAGKAIVIKNQWPLNNPLKYNSNDNLIILARSFSISSLLAKIGNSKAPIARIDLTPAVRPYGLS